MSGNTPTVSENSDLETLVERAMNFAVRAHQRIDQRRKYSGQPYEAHLAAVVKILSQVTDDPVVLAAAWLHDVVEDTPATIEDIESEFGHRVARIVGELTDVSRPGDGNRAHRKHLDTQHLALASPDAQTVKLADLIDNCEDIFPANPRFGRVFLGEAEVLVSVLQLGDCRLRSMLSRLLDQWRSRLSNQKLADGLQEYVAIGPHQRQVMSIVIGRFTASDLARPAVRKRTVIGAQHLAPEASLIDVIQVLTRYRNCLIQSEVGEPLQIERTDFNQPVARMWLFGILTSIELDLRGHVRAALAEPVWMSALSDQRLDKARQLCAERRRRGEHCDLLDCLQLGDQLSILLAQKDFVQSSGYRSKQAMRRVFSDLEALRNQLAHGQHIGPPLWPSIARLARHLAEQAHRAVDVEYELNFGSGKDPSNPA